MILETSAGLRGHGLTFTIGRGNDLCVEAARCLAERFVVGRSLDDIVRQFGAFWHGMVTGDCQLRWLGPEKGVIHLATGYPGYTTAAGWLGYSEAKLRALARQAVAEGWTHFKQKVGADIDQDLRRARILREEIGWDRKLMMDANQAWGVEQAVRNMGRLAECAPWWIEEPTSPDDVLGHAEIRRRISPIGVATGEHACNRVLFKQLFQAKALDFCQPDPTRLGGLNEVLAVVLMAAKFGVPVCPHGGGVGLCQYSQNIVLFDYIAVSASLENRVLEYVDHLHENFEEPIVIRNGSYLPPTRPGYGATLKEESLRRFHFPDGEAWNGGRLARD